MRTGKVLSLIVGGVFALLAVLMLAVWLLVNPNHYKAKIVGAVKDATGRDLVLEGDIKLSLLPWIALELGPATLGNPPGFSAQPFVSFQHAAVRAKLLPLLRERLEIARVEIDGLDVRLQKNAAGLGNWEGFGGSTARAPASDAADTGRSPLGSLAGFRVTHARVSYQNFLLENLNVESAASGGVVPISIHFDADRGVAGERASVEAKVDVSNPATKRYRFAALRLMGQITHAGDGRAADWNLSVPAVDLDLAAQTLAAPAFALDVAGAQVSGDVHGSGLLAEPRLAGSVTLAPLLIREFLPRLGVANPQTRDARAFSDVSGATAFTYEGQALTLKNLKVALDDTHVEGVVAIENLKTQALKFTLNVDRLDVDRYLAPEGQPAAAAPAADGPGLGQRPAANP